MCLVNLFDPCGVPNVHFTFVAYLLMQFFPNVTSINLSATIWSHHAFGLINWVRIEKLIWNKCLCTNLFLPHLGTSANLLELQLDNSTLTVPETMENLYDLITDTHPFPIFHHLNTCNQLNNYHAQIVGSTGIK